MQVLEATLSRNATHLRLEELLLLHRSDDDEDCILNAHEG